MTLLAFQGMLCFYTPSSSVDYLRVPCALRG
jgi:hypothetical protein